MWKERRKTGRRRKGREIVVERGEGEVSREELKGGRERGRVAKRTKKKLKWSQGRKEESEGRGRGRLKKKREGKKKR